MNGRSHRRPLRSAVLTLVVVVLAGTGTVAALRHNDDKPGSTPSGDVPLARVAPPRPAETTVRSAAERRSDALDAVLATRARAVLRRDRAGFLATVDTSVAEFWRGQQRLFDALSTLRFSSWRYDVDAPATGRTVPKPGRFPGAAEIYAPRGLLVLYQLASYDTAPTSTRAGLTFVRRGTRWLLAADSDFDRSSGRTQREVWDYGPLTTVRGPRTLVIGSPASRPLLLMLRDEAERAIPRVSAVWGRRWSQRVAIVAPASQRQLATILNKSYASLSRIAAVATAELGDAAAAPSVGNRILINPANVDRLGTRGRQIVMTHEITHVATREATTAGAPTWLVEGFADYVAYRSTPVPVAAAANELRTAVRAGRLPDALPTDKDFDGTNPKLAQAYEEAWLAVRLIAEREGTAGLLTFFRAVTGAPASERGTALSDALVSGVGVTLAGFTALWRSYLSKTLA